MINDCLKSIIFTCEIIIINLTCEIISFISARNSLIIHILIVQYPGLNKSRACLFIPAREHSLCNNTKDDCYANYIKIFI